MEIENGSWGKRRERGRQLNVGEEERNRQEREGSKNEEKDE